MRSAANPAYADPADRRLQDGSARTATRAELAMRRVRTPGSTERQRCTLLRIRLGLRRLVIRCVAGRRHIRGALIHLHASGFGRPWAFDRIAEIGHSGGSGAMRIPGAAIVSRKRCTRYAQRHCSHARHDNGQNCLVHFDSPGKRCKIASRHLIYGLIPALDAYRQQRCRCASGLLSSLRGNVTSRYQSRIRVSPVNENRP
jgi:hypothetical protein